MCSRACAARTASAELCRREGIAESRYYSWPKEFLEAGKKRLSGDTARQASSGEVKDLRTTNPIESTFATVRLRTIKTKGCLSRTTALTTVFKLCQSAAKKWRRLDGSHRLAEIVEGVKFKDGEKLIERAA